MNGKKLKVSEYELKFGESTKFVNVLGLIKYKPTNNLFVIYTDINPEYDIIYYGSSHIKNNSILSMSCKQETVEPLIKEYIYTIINKENHEKFQELSLEKIDQIEIISSNRIEIKKEILNTLIDLAIPKPETSKVSPPQKAKKEISSPKKFSKYIILIFLIFLLSGTIYLFTTNKLTPNKSSSNKIICQKEYQPKELKNVTTTEKLVFNFDNDDTLASVDSESNYKFKTKEDYISFVEKGLYNKYSDEQTEVNPIDSKLIIQFKKSETVDYLYSKPTNYEEVISYYTKDDYKCDEEIK